MTLLSFALFSDAYVWNMSNSAVNNEYMYIHTCLQTYPWWTTKIIVCLIVFRVCYLWQIVPFDELRHFPLVRSFCSGPKRTHDKNIFPTCWDHAYWRSLCQFLLNSTSCIHNLSWIFSQISHFVREGEALATFKIWVVDEGRKHIFHIHQWWQIIKCINRRWRHLLIVTRVIYHSHSTSAQLSNGVQKTFSRTHEKSFIK